MKTSSSNINESGTLKTEKVYYKDGKFWFLEGDKWPEKIEPIPVSENKEFEMKFRENADQCYKLGKSLYDKAITSALQQAIEFEDQEAIQLEVQTNNGWDLLKEGLYTIPEQEVEIVTSGYRHAPDVDRLARLVPSSLEKQEKKLPNINTMENRTIEPVPEYVFDSHEIKNPFDYFYNEKGDYTVTMHGNPICFVKDEHTAITFKNSYSSLTLRMDVMKKQIQALHRNIKVYESLPSNKENKPSSLEETLSKIPKGKLDSHYKGNKENKTLQQCKNEIAEKYGYKDWSDIKFYAEHGFHPATLNTHERYSSEAAELYASQFKGSLQGEDQEEQIEIFKAFYGVCVDDNGLDLDTAIKLYHIERKPENK